MTRNWNSTSTARFSEITERCADRSTPLFMLFDVSCGLDVEVRGGTVPLILPFSFSKALIFSLMRNCRYTVYSNKSKEWFYEDSDSRFKGDYGE